MIKGDRTKHYSHNKFVMKTDGKTKTSTYQTVTFISKT